MRFNEYIYEHMDLECVKKKLEHVKDQLVSADDFDAFFAGFKELNEVEKEIDSYATLCRIRHSINTGDDYYAKENEYLDTILPQIQNTVHEVNDVVLSSPFISVLKTRVPHTYFLMKQMEKKSFSSAIVVDLQEENKLTSMYQALIAGAQICFDDKTYTLSELDAKMKVVDRNIRKRATKAYWGWFEEHESELAGIFDRLVQVRHRMAVKMGYPNYITLGYYRMNRFDYDPKDIADYRKQIRDSVVPLNNELYARQQRRLGIDALYAWDEKNEFERSPIPKYKRKELVERAFTMYQELSPGTGEFFPFMVSHDLLDLDSKPNKASGGYCTYIPKYRSPFIFANFNGTSADTEVLTHEFGHAYQVYKSQDIFPNSCIWPTYESCEIHSMTMEFLTYPWMHLFFGNDTEKYFYNHLAGVMKFLPYGALVDHFQHEVYAHPEWRHTDRMACWRRLEKQYCPHKNNAEIDILERGGWWLRQLHIFMDPFYYIDYVLAQVCALQFWVRMQKKDSDVLTDYEKICDAGGSLTFKQIVQLAGLKTPFASDCLDEVAAYVTSWFHQSQL